MGIKIRMGGRRGNTVYVPQNIYNSIASQQFSPNQQTIATAYQNLYKNGANVATQQQAQQPQPQIVTQPPNIVPNQQMANTANNTNFSATDSSDYHDLYNGRQYYLSQTLSIQSQIALQMYMAPDPETINANAAAKAGHGMYNTAQNLNYALANGLPLSANQQYMQQGLNDAMHNLGYNLNLTRYDHPEFVNSMLHSLGVNGNYDQLTAAQLKSALVGASYTQNQFISTTYNGFKNAPASSQNTFATRAVKITYRAPASTQAVMTGNGGGGALGEILLAPQTSGNARIVDVNVIGNKARYKSTQNYGARQIEIVIQL